MKLEGSHTTVRMCICKDLGCQGYGCKVLAERSSIAMHIASVYKEFV